jgi:hypothetical protein
VTRISLIGFSSGNEAYSPLDYRSLVIDMAVVNVLSSGDGCWRRGKATRTPSAVVVGFRVGAAGNSNDPVCRRPKGRGRTVALSEAETPITLNPSLKTCQQAGGPPREQNVLHSTKLAVNLPLTHPRPRGSIIITYPFCYEEYNKHCICLVASPCINLRG